MFTKARWNRCLLAPFLAYLAAGCSQQTATRPSVDERIRYYSEKTAAQPRLYPVYAQLGAAYLDKARQTHDPSYLKRARRVLHQSLEIQPNFLALKAMAAVCNYAHHFEEGLHWARRASEANPADTAVTALLAESHMGLGQLDEAQASLTRGTTAPGDFHLAAAQGRWLASQGRFDQAAKAFQDAAGFARNEGVIELVVWAEVNTAGALIDAGRLERTRHHLAAAARLDPTNGELRIHQAELLEAQGKLDEALKSYEAILEGSNDATIHARAFALARKLGQEALARKHFATAEKGFRGVIEAGEVYTLGALARLYLAADVRLETALDLAKQNLRFKRDIEAGTILDSIRRKIDVSRSAKKTGPIPRKADQAP